MKLHFLTLLLGSLTLSMATSVSASTYGQASIAQLKAFAARGDVMAMSILASRYDTGQGVRENNREAVLWYQKAAQGGHVKSQYNLALMYDTGEGVPVDKRLALIWYRIAGEQGDLAAQANVGAMYDRGEGAPMDKAEAVRWFKKAANKGDVASQYNLGLMYLNGQGVERDINAAVKWYSLAAQQGDVDAKKALARLSSASFIPPASTTAVTTQLTVTSRSSQAARPVSEPVSVATSEKSATAASSPTKDKKTTTRSDQSKAELTQEAVVFDPPSNIRKTPDGKKVVCKIEAKRTIKVSGSGDWLSTKACGTKGYIHRKQVRLL